MPDSPSEHKNLRISPEVKIFCVSARLLNRSVYGGTENHFAFCIRTTSIKESSVLLSSFGFG